MFSIDHKQELMKILGESGCYFLSILFLAERISGKKIDPLATFIECCEKGIIDKDGTILDAGKVMSTLTGLSFSAKKENADYKPQQGEFEVLVFNNEKYTHFVAGDSKGAVACDPLGHSNTVATGKIIGKRIFYRV
ncbi:MAG: DUF261 domain-containing protein [Treponema sp.]|nr:DUF261 domain-containing protein [Treponema sp.]